MTSTAPQALIAPHGGTLVDLRLPADQWEAAIAGVDHRVECSDRNACDVELLMVGGFSPLRGFVGEEDCRSVVESNRTCLQDTFLNSILYLDRTFNYQCPCCM